MNARPLTSRILVFAVLLAVLGGTTSLFAQSSPKGSLKAMAQPKITMSEAINTAVQANSNAATVAARLGNENGYLVYSVKLDNGLDVKVDAGNGKILSTDHWNNRESSVADNGSVGDQQGGSDGEHADGEQGGAGQSNGPNVESYN